MRLTLRPSKTFLFEALERRLRPLRGGYGLDAASAHMKNRWMFRTDAYVGLDTDRSALDDGLKRDGQGPDAYALEADLTARVPLPDGFFRVVVSTNTLAHLDAAARASAAGDLARLTARGGVLLCELPIDDGSVRERLAAAFSDVKPTYFKNHVSRLYERFFERDGWLGSHPLAGRKPFLILAWLISRLEYLTMRCRSCNAHVLYVCVGKKDAASPGREEAARLLASVTRRA